MSRRLLPLLGSRRPITRIKSIGTVKLPHSSVGQDAHEPSTFHLRRDNAMHLNHDSDACYLLILPYSRTHSTGHRHLQEHVYASVGCM